MNRNRSYKKTKRHIPASKIGQAEYCPYALYLSEIGHRPNARTRSLVDAGNKAHNQFNKEHKPSKIPLIGFLLLLLLLYIIIYAFQ